MRSSKEQSVMGRSTSEFKGSRVGRESMGSQRGVLLQEEWLYTHLAFWVVDKEQLFGF